MTHALRLAGWIFEFGLFGLLVATLIYTYRLDRSIGQMRAERSALQALIDQIGTSINAAISATGRLKDQASQSALALDDACQAAEVSTRRLDELISEATLILNRPPVAERREGKSTSAVMPAISAIKPGQTGGSCSQPAPPPSHSHSSSTRAAASQRSAKQQSRAERELARMLLDAS